MEYTIVLVTFLLLSRDAVMKSTYKTNHLTRDLFTVSEVESLTTMVAYTAADRQA